MNEIKIHPMTRYGHDFIPFEYLPEDKSEYYLRDEQLALPKSYWRHLRSGEIESLVKNANSCEIWDNIYVTDPFSPHLIKNCQFSGLVRIGKMEDIILEHHNLQVPAGISNSTIIACDIGDNCAVHNVNYLAHYIIGNCVILFNINEMHTTNHAKFGNGIIKEGEPESVRIWLELMNEMGGRAVLPFDGMIPADAYIWLKYRHFKEFQERLREITQNRFDHRRGYYGTVGDYSVIKNNRIIKDVKTGACCYIKGANKLKNLTINSSADEPTQIGEGVELVNGIIGYGCRIFYGCKAVRFIMGRNSNLKYGARLIHSYLGDNSTVSCCEILHNLIFPAHEQHHNNSFLIASLVMGQSNLAAGASVGSNHNSRANDGEIQAGRGFWPGLSVTLKHSSRFVSFVLIAKGNYPAELNIPLPFCLLNDEKGNNVLEIMPAYWWMYNMYALARNSSKFQKRDKRKIKGQHIEFDSLAPDTVEEMFTALRLLEIWTAKAYMRKNGEPVHTKTDDELAVPGRKLLLDTAEKTKRLEITGEKMEKTGRKVVILKAREGYHAYLQMIHYYAMKNLLVYLEEHPEATLASINKEFVGERETRWVNLGGQLAREKDVFELINKITKREINSWDDIHDYYNVLWEKYGKDKQHHAYASLLTLLDMDTITPSTWMEQLDRVLKTQEYICEQVYISRKKDYDNPFRQATFDSREEMTAVIHTPEENSFVLQVKEETEEFKKNIERIRKRELP
ncbi:MAG: DUF4954 family protein [Spirochaetales bacterium]|nr:DUF4954 family protein [Spirochaetales bacterium]